MVEAQTSFEGATEPMSTFRIGMSPPDLQYEWSMGPVGDASPLEVEGPLLEGFIVSGQIIVSVRAFDEERLVDERTFIVSAHGSSEPPLLLEQDAHQLAAGDPLEVVAKALDLARPEAGYLDLWQVYTMEQLDWFVVPAEGLAPPLLSLEQPIDPVAPQETARFIHRFEHPGIYWVHVRARLVGGGFAIGSASVLVE